MDPNQNPPSEREWTIEEREEFFKSQDAITGAISGDPINTEPYRPKPTLHDCGLDIAASWKNGPPLTPMSIDDFERFFSPGIHVTRVGTPEQGWLMSFYCPLCKETWFMISPWAIKPEDGEYWHMNEVCANDQNCVKHNMLFALKPPTPTKLKLFTEFYYPTRNTISFQLLDPGPALDKSDVVEITEEITIEEAKRRYPNSAHLIDGDKPKSS